jgi:hypothetical protein
MGCNRSREDCTQSRVSSSRGRAPGIELQQRGAIHAVVEERADRLRIEFHDAGRALLPQLGNQQVAVFRIAIDFQREHV